MVSLSPRTLFTVPCAASCIPLLCCSGFVSAAVPSGGRQETSALEYCHFQFIIQQHLTLQSVERLLVLCHSALGWHTRHLKSLPLLPEPRDWLPWVSRGHVHCAFSRACCSRRIDEVKTIKMTNEPIKEILGAPKHPDSTTTEKSNNNDCVITTIPLVRECQLTAATGGAELSCYRCTVPFGVVILIAGIVVTAVAYSFNSHGSIISVFGLVLLSSGLLLLASSAVCWKIRQQNKKAKRRESQTALVANQRTLFG
ncbi:transmembrane protein 100 isoform X2 [Caloenas nicobarica]|uniref:transmembrane protein 100 isoform X2 n=1 Tax=Caloenas nicobarica TaxID=187106 RepID=UPI0032B80A02